MTRMHQMLNFRLFMRILPRDLDALHLIIRQKPESRLVDFTALPASLRSLKLSLKNLSPEEIAQQPRRLTRSHLWQSSFPAIVNVDAHTQLPYLEWPAISGPIIKCYDLEQIFFPLH